MRSLLLSPGWDLKMRVTKFIHSFVHSHDKNLLSTYYMQDTAVDIRNTEINNTHSSDSYSTSITTNYPSAVSA